MSIPYRSDIDGLRAIAILTVVAFHAFPEVFPGGFIGVDVFFVISGFLITSILQQEMDAGRWSLASFYARRVLRIFPALVLVLLACLIAGWHTLLAQEYMQLGKHLGLGAAFLSNLGLWWEAGYFDKVSEAKPLLHLWSLAIEEQFYIVWPLLLWLILRSRRSAARSVATLAAVSLLLSIWWCGAIALRPSIRRRAGPGSCLREHGWPCSPSVCSPCVLRYGVLQLQSCWARRCC